jgi:large subunit ribosomal protein L16
MLMPKRTRYRKHHRGRRSGLALKGNTIAFGTYALQAQEEGWLTSRQIEAGRRAIVGYTKRGGKTWIRVFPHKPVTQKPAETRMGSGKGGVEFWVAIAKPGRIVFEMAGVPEATAQEALRRAAMKLPVKCKFLVREEEAGGGSE